MNYGILAIGRGDGVKGKLKPWKEVILLFESEYKGNDNYRVYHSSGTIIDKGPSLRFYTKDWPKDEIHMQESNTYVDRQLYMSYTGFLYYDEWFEWIGEEQKIIELLPDSLWDISDW